MMFLVSAFFISSCSEDPVSGVLHEYSINAYDYSDAHYFLDTLYKSSFNDFFKVEPSVLNPETEANRVYIDDSSFEVWVQTDSIDANKRLGSAMTMLYEQPKAGYHPNLKLIYSVEGIRFGGYFRKLNPSDYIAYHYAGFISLRINVPNDYAIGVTYNTHNGKLYGTPSNTISANDTLILKMIKCSNQSPDATPLAWELKMKNIYRLPFSNFNFIFFNMNAVYLQDGTYQNNLPGQDKPLSEMLNLGRYIINTYTGDIIIRTLRPFWDNLEKEGVDSTYFYKEIYTKSKVDAANPSISPNANKYLVRGSITLQ